MSAMLKGQKSLKIYWNVYRCESNNVSNGISNYLLEILTNYFDY